MKEWGLEEWGEEILARWNEINLYSMTRGINRFKGLAPALSEIDAKYKPIEGVGELVRWAEEAKELSNPALKKVVDERPESVIFKKALSRSEAVNRSNTLLPEEAVKPFPLAKEAFVGKDPIDSFCGLWDARI